MATCRRVMKDLSSSPWTKLNSKWFKDLNIRSESLNLIEEKMVNFLELVNIVKVFLNRTPIAQALRSTMEPYKAKKLLYNKGHHHSDKLAGYRISKDFFLSTTPLLEG